MTMGSEKPERRPFTLAVDIGGTGVKAEKLDGAGKPITERTNGTVPTPWDLRRDLLHLAQQVWRPGGLGDAPAAPTRGGEPSA
jgi:hypothetical protein